MTSELSMEVRSVAELREFLAQIDRLNISDNSRIKAIVKIGGNLWKLRVLTGGEAPK